MRFVFFILLLLFPGLLMAQDNEDSLSRQIIGLSQQVTSLVQQNAQLALRVDELSGLFKETKAALDAAKEELDALKAPEKGDSIQEAKNEMERLSGSFVKLQENVISIGEDLQLLNARFSQGTFNGTLVYTKDEASLYTSDEKKMAALPRGISVVRNQKDPGDLSLAFSFYLVDEKYNEAIAKGTPMTNPPISLQVHLPAHLLLKTPVTIPLSLGQPTHSSSTAAVKFPFAESFDLLEKGELSLQTATSQQASGKVDLLFKNRVNKNKVQLTLQFNTPPDSNPFWIGNQN